MPQSERGLTPKARLSAFTARISHHPPRPGQTRLPIRLLFGQMHDFFFVDAVEKKSRDEGSSFRIIPPFTRGSYRRDCAPHSYETDTKTSIWARSRRAPRAPRAPWTPEHPFLFSKVPFPAAADAARGMWNSPYKSAPRGKGLESGAGGAGKKLGSSGGATARERERRDATDLRPRAHSGAGHLCHYLFEYWLRLNKLYLLHL